MPRLDLGLLGLAALIIAAVFVRHVRSSTVVDNGVASEIGLSDLVVQLKGDLLELQQSEEQRVRANPGSRALLLFDSAEVEVSFVIKKGTDGKIKAVPIEAGINYSQEQVQRIKLRLLPNTAPREGTVGPDQ